MRITYLERELSAPVTTRKIKTLAGVVSALAMFRGLGYRIVSVS